MRLRLLLIFFRFVFRRLWFFSIFSLHKFILFWKFLYSEAQFFNFNRVFLCHLLFPPQHLILNFVVLQLFVELIDLHFVFDDNLIDLLVRNQFAGWSRASFFPRASWNLMNFVGSLGERWNVKAWKGPAFFVFHENAGLKIFNDRIGVFEKFRVVEFFLVFGVDGERGMSLWKGICKILFLLEFVIINSFLEESILVQKSANF